MALETSVALFLTAHGGFMQQLRKWFVPLVLTLAIGTVLPLHLNGEIFIQQVLPFCVPPLSSNWIPWVQLGGYWIPSTVLCTISSCMMLLAMVKIIRQSMGPSADVQTRDSTGHSCFWSNLCCDFMLWWTHLFGTYILRIFLLVIMFNFFLLVTTYTVFDFVANASKYRVCMVVELLYGNLRVTQSNAKDYFGCQFTYSVKDPQTGYERCGEPEDWDMGPSDWTFFFNVLSVSMYGMVNEIVQLRIVRTTELSVVCRSLSLCSESTTTASL
jgi:hypothetical protein